MATVTLIAAVVLLTLTIFVLWINPHRFSNQAFALCSLVQTMWLACIHRAMRIPSPALHNAVEELDFWLRTNAAVIALLPASLWLLKNAILVGPQRLYAIKRALPLLSLALVAIGFVYSKFFLFIDLNGQIKRGSLYYLFSIASMLIYGAYIIEILRHIRNYSGIRRLELQFLALTTGGSALIIGFLNIIGNFLYIRVLNNFGIIVILAASGVTAWALLFHRVFNAKEVLIQLCQRSTFILFTCGGTYLLWSVIHLHVAEPFGMLFSTGICACAAVWLGRFSRNWFESGSRRKLQLMRNAAIEIGNVEVQTDAIVSRFELLLRSECETESCTLLFDDGEGYSGKDVRVRKDRPGFGALVDIGWTTPESLLRRKPTGPLTDLQDFVESNHLGLLLTTPRGSPNPSIVIALGKRADEAPFTYPEIERLQLVAGLLDNLLARSRQAAHAALQARLEYLAIASRGLAHDLKNLITPVSSYLVHTDGIFAENSPAGEVHAAAQKATRVMSDYVRENLFFSEKLTPRLERFELHALLEQVRDVTQIPSSTRNVSVALSESGAEDFVADRVLLQRMLVNLVTNAIDASTEGGTVSVSVRNIRPGWVRFDVADQGSGIPADYINRIFDPFFTTKEFGDELRGFGLGLTIAQKIVLLHHGRISVCSQPGQGTVFSVELPNLHDDPTSASVEAQEPAHFPIPTVAPIAS